MQQDYEKLRGLIWFNGKLIKASKAKLHVLSHSLHFASAVFEGIRVYNKKPFKLKKHIDRLFYSAKILDIKIPFSKKKILTSCKIIVQKQNLNSGYLRPIIWRGGQSMAPAIPNAKINVAIAGWDWPVYYSKSAKRKGIALNISRWKRPPNDCAPTQSKCSGLYMICTMAKHEAERKGFDDALMLDLKKNICETTSSNVFFIKKNKVITPKPENFLDGITRQEVIKICKINNIKIIEKKIKFKELNKMDACFVTGTAAEVTPIKQVGKKYFDTNNRLLVEIMNKFEKKINLKNVS
jgi:branched-chain amino acid aminotransferase